MGILLKEARANALTSSRYLLGVLVLILFSVGTDWALLAVVVLLALAAASDALDGPIARHNRAVRSDGTALDPLADDFVTLTALLCLLSAGVVPLWFAALVLWLRMSLVLVRMLSAVRHERFPIPRFSTRASMAGLYAAEIVLFAREALGDSWPWLDAEATATLILVGMTTLIAWAAVDFVLRTHREAIAGLFRTAERSRPPVRAPRPARASGNGAIPSDATPSTTSRPIEPVGSGASHDPTG